MLSLCVEEHVNGPVAISGLGLMYPIFSQAVGEMLKKIGIKKLPSPIADPAFPQNASPRPKFIIVYNTATAGVLGFREEREIVCLSLVSQSQNKYCFPIFFAPSSQIFQTGKIKALRALLDCEYNLQEQQGCNRQKHAISLCQMDIRQVPLFSTQSSQLQCWS